MVFGGKIMNNMYKWDSKYDTATFEADLGRNERHGIESNLEVCQDNRAFFKFISKIKNIFKKDKTSKKGE